MKFTDVLFVNPCQYKLSSSPLPRKLLLEGDSKLCLKNEFIQENEISENENFPVFIAEEKPVPNCFSTFNSPQVKRGEGFYFPRR